MPNITINGQEYEVEAGKTVLQAALENGIYIPHFCYHPELSIAGNCRMCLVDIKPGPPKLSIACNTVVSDGMEVDTENEKVYAARQAVMEFILKNHPIDCPICDEAGQCQLQDYYMRYGLKPARVRTDDKVSKRKAQKIGDRLVLDGDRCIVCSRCVRYMAEVAGDDCLTIMNRRDSSEITLFPGKTIDHPYSMNLPDVCPVGAWTSADFRFKKRAWYLTAQPSVCPVCARGCNTYIDHQKGEVFRIKPRPNAEINKCFLCDEGRLAYHAINENRLLAPAVQKGDDGQEEATWDEALLRAAALINEAGSNLVVVASASLTVEAGEKVVAIFKEGLKAKVLLNADESGEDDEILRRADKNANLKGLAELGLTDKLGAELPEDAVVVCLETLYSPALAEAVPAPSVVISPSLSPAALAAVVALPTASYAESSGTFVNFEGNKQSFAPAISVAGEALPLVELLDRLGKALDAAKLEAVSG